MTAQEKFRVDVILTSYNEYRIVKDEKYFTDFIKSRVDNTRQSLPERVFLRIIKNQ